MSRDRWVARMTALAAVRRGRHGARLCDPLRKGNKSAMPKPWKYLATAALTLGASAMPAHAAKAPATPPPAAGYTMPSTQVWDMKADSGEVYRIFVSYPAANVEVPAGGFPVLYVLDGNALFASFAETRRIQEFADVGKSIVVGVGYPTDDAYDVRRLYDLTGGPPPPPWDVEFAKERNGGWDKFLDFLTGKLRTEIAARYKTNPQRQALFGHSLGGLFAIHTLFTRPDAFHAIVAASPSLFWHHQEMLKEERAFTAALQAGTITNPARLMVVAGERDETALEFWDPQDFAKRMEPLSVYGLRSRSRTYPEEGHITVPSRSVTETLRFAFTWP
ncbi:alpha/beta hydrolase [Novosphingobium resinovorum]|uniref:alpha/beta hydrolase n=1 Tax=Novosphingobium resinovorum TaxID=158500 RepID=UPI002ED05FDF|nr:alpha/beta hydrolase-fold protein [Novosphingobium resinovorum]